MAEKCVDAPPRSAPLAPLATPLSVQLVYNTLFEESNHFFQNTSLYAVRRFD